MLTIGLLGSSLADAVDRRKLVLTPRAASPSCRPVLPHRRSLGLSVLWLLYGLVAVQSALGAVNIASQANLPAAAAARGLRRRACIEQAHVPGHAHRRPGIGGPDHGRGEAGCERAT